MKNVIIYQRVLPHYRIVFFEQLYELLLERNIRLIVCYGKEYPGTVPKSVPADAKWAKYRKNYYLKFLGKEIVFQTPIFTSLFDSSYVIVEQANRLVLNYILLINSFFFKKRLAFWGHGRNFQSTNGGGFAESFKRKYSNLVSWWFCYTEQGKEIVQQSGFCPDKITVVANSVDTASLSKTLKQLSEDEIEKSKRSLNIESENICIYCGGLYSEKRVNFLLEACKAIKASVPDFHMIFIGDGPDDYMVKQFCVKHGWAHFLGPISGPEKIKFFAMSKCQLMPGLVGLGIIDSFALLTPIVTTNYRYHSPEISYLENNKNGVVTDNSLEAFVVEVTDLLLNRNRLQILIEGCARSTQYYSIERMVENYKEGVISFSRL